MKTQKEPGQIAWQDYEVGVRTVMFHLACEWSHFETERLDLSLFPEEEVLWEINWRSDRFLGKNFAKFAREALERSAAKGIEAVEQNRLFEYHCGKERLRFPISDRAAQTYDLGTNTIRDRTCQILGCQPWISASYQPNLLDGLTRRWLKAWLKLGFASKEEVGNWLWETAKANEGNLSWYAQEILGVALCPACHQQVTGREPGTVYPDLCPKCQEEIRTNPDIYWCPICQGIFGYDPDGQITCGCV
jgi:hypothetical protein